MEITRVVVTEAPGMGGLEFLLQWLGLMIQAAVAAGTIGAVAVALYGLRSARDREEKARDERGTFVLMAIAPELRRLRTSFTNCENALWRVMQHFEGDRREGPYTPSAHTQHVLKTASASLSTPMLTGMRVDLIALRNGLSLDAVTIESKLPQVSIWMERMGHAAVPWMDAGLEPLAKSAFEDICDCSVRLDRLLEAAGVPQIGS